MNSKPMNLALLYALSSIATNPSMSHMRKAAYTPVPPSIKNDKEIMAKAEAKRQRKMQRNIKNER